MAQGPEQFRKIVQPINYLQEKSDGTVGWDLSPDQHIVFITFFLLRRPICITIGITIRNTISAADIPPATRTDAPCIAYEAAQFLQKQEHSCIAQVKYRRHWTTNSFSFQAARMLRDFSCSNEWAGQCIAVTMARSILERSF